MKEFVELVRQMRKRQIEFAVLDVKTKLFSDEMSELDWEKHASASNEMVRLEAKVDMFINAWRG